MIFGNDKPKEIVTDLSKIIKMGNNEQVLLFIAMEALITGANDKAKDLLHAKDLKIVELEATNKTLREVLKT